MAITKEKRKEVLLKSLYKCIKIPPFSEFYVSSTLQTRTSRLPQTRGARGVLPPQSSREIFGREVQALMKFSRGMKVMALCVVAFTVMTRALSKKQSEDGHTKLSLPQSTFDPGTNANIAEERCRGTTPRISTSGCRCHCTSAIVATARILEGGDTLIVGAKEVKRKEKNVGSVEGGPGVGNGRAPYMDGRPPELLGPAGSSGFLKYDSRTTINAAMVPSLELGVSLSNTKQPSQVFDESGNCFNNTRRSSDRYTRAQ
ncbi:hypothetical protein C8F01DRAFT_1084904 [Mycena amicta]|nr:hypothetical protein C8F01DRAFT_1084904 [Mycena amicta]